MSEVNENNSGNKTPLSQATGKKKILVGIPSAIVAGVFYVAGIAPSLMKMLAVVFTAYAIVGFVEVLFGESLTSTAKNWDSLPSWKKFVISLLVITVVMAIFLFIA